MQSIMLPMTMISGAGHEYRTALRRVINMKMTEQVYVKADIVDFDSSTQLAKIKIHGFSDDNRTPIKKYIKVPLKDLNNLNVSLDKNSVSGK